MPALQCPVVPKLSFLALPSLGSKDPLPSRSQEASVYLARWKAELTEEVIQ